MVTYTKEVTFHKCERCGHEWQQRIERRPEICPNCKSRSWDKSKEEQARSKIRSLTIASIKRGELKRLPCEICGAEPTEAHHDDYTNTARGEHMSQYTYAALVMVLGGILISTAKAQESRKHVIIVTTLQLAATGIDAWRTDINRQSHGWEGNPIARPFVMGGRPALAGYFGCQLTLKLVLPRLLRRNGHRRMAAAAEIYGIVDNAWSGGYSWAHTTR